MTSGPPLLAGPHKGPVFFGLGLEPSPFSFVQCLMIAKVSLLVVFVVLSLRTGAAQAELISTGVGVVRGQVMTSREVLIQNLIETALYDKDPKANLKSPGLDSKAFAKAVQDSLLESVVALEAQNFNVVQLTPDEIQAAERKAMANLKNAAPWKELKVSPKEFEAGVKRKVQAKKFVQFRAQSSVLPVTDIEAQKYFNENRLKFGNLPFENFKENIKSYLSRAQVDKRLKDWYDVLLGKYQVKNLISES